MCYFSPQIISKIISFRYFVYAQGVPLLIVSMTAIVDSQKPTSHGNETSVEESQPNIDNICMMATVENSTSYGNGTSQYYPNMGVYECFLGYDPFIRDSYFVQTPGFIYFQVYLIILQFANIFFLSCTVRSIHETFRNKKQLRRVSTFLYFFAFNQIRP